MDDLAERTHAALAEGGPLARDLAGYVPRAAQQQLAGAVENIQQNGQNKKAAYENILWALINSKAFLFNQ